MFDSPDTADIALMNLRSKGVKFSNVALHNGGPVDMDDNRIGRLIFPMFGFSPDVNTRGYGVPIFADVRDHEDRVIKDALGGESKLEVDVDEANEDLAREIFTSSHGHGIVS
jgi:hypothetical protein